MDAAVAFQPSRALGYSGERRGISTEVTRSPRGRGRRCRRAGKSLHPVIVVGGQHRAVGIHRYGGCRVELPIGITQAPPRRAKNSGAVNTSMRSLPSSTVKIVSAPAAM